MDLASVARQVTRAVSDGTGVPERELLLVASVTAVGLTIKGAVYGTGRVLDFLAALTPGGAVRPDH